jgi:hypothetical protein
MSHLFVLYLHVAVAVLLARNTAASRLAERNVLAAAELATLRGALSVLQQITRFNPLLAIALLLSGAYLGRQGMWATPWFAVAVAAWFANLALVVRYVVPNHKALGQAAGAAGDGPVVQAIDVLRKARAPARALDAMIGLDFGVLMLMVTRPGIGLSLVWPALGVAAMLAYRVLAGAPKGLSSARTVAGR